MLPKKLINPLLAPGDRLNGVIEGSTTEILDMNDISHPGDHSQSHLFDL
jgi:hypothetical protein